MAERLRGIEISVRRPMDGSNQGLHRSPAFGSSVEFAEYREYMPGDPISAETAATIPNLHTKLRARVFYIPGTEPQSLAGAVPAKGHRSLEPRSSKASAEPPTADAPAETPKKKKKRWSGKPAEE